ncbi:Pyridoxine 5'-phosphate synthase [Alkalidesulfovibrio alkalitolerans DSM 16529]|uniref:Pyridoxine 5'-phosphate synthase n=1 Tax=Alkalidesulfovibrio alkalitolerans DSM 16529 TaxID=1121439 RepID=S7U928_9BACT|nr:pyridoxine 5'-phosphate synthase [Alkalidesulfovibrio alkalitolerans]EPR30449.1 Pyridoxine 5'-phosphate synthase [Alkalidesulfovibrio alkalitolerans DSM 16529]
MPVLSVNVDHVATLRQQRLGIEPEPVTAALMAELAGARGIIVHLREDRRHIQDRDVRVLREAIQTRLHLEMAATEEMRSIALSVRPDTVCLVPEKREELTTEGGLSVAGREDFLRRYLEPIWEAGIASSLFIDADPAQMEAAARIKTQFIEIHTGHYADAKDSATRDTELRKIVAAIAQGKELGLKVNLGHGLNYVNVHAFGRVPGVCEYSIGHSIVSRAVLTGLSEAVRRMADIVESFAD